MAMLTMAAAQEAFKTFYLPVMQYQLNTANPILSVIDKDSTAVQGSDIVMALRYGRQGGFGMRADDGDLPTPNSRKTKQAKWGTKNIMHNIQLTDKAIKASRGREGAFVSQLEAELSDATDDAKDNQARMTFMDGSGILTKTKEATSATTVPVENAQYLAEGQLIDILDSNGVIKAKSREIIVVDDTEGASSITISGAAVTTTDTDIITIAGNYMEELTGFGAVFTPNNTLYNIDRSVNKWFNPTVKALDGEISEVAIQKQIDDCERKAGGKIDFLSSSYGVRRAYQNLLLATKQITNVMKLEGGYEALSYNGKPFAVDKYNPAGTLFGLDLSTWKMYHLEDFNWMSDDGAVLSRVSNKAAYGATLIRYCDLGCNKPRGNFKMTGIVEH